MKISFNWLNEFIPTGLSAEEAGKLLTGSGLEVEGIIPYESLRGGLEGIVIGEVCTKIRHPNADKLSVTTVNIGGENDLQIVCGAPNVEAGQKVLVATVGSMLYPAQGEPFKISKSKIRGEVSEGMICAEDEIGLGSSHDGILVLPAEYETGKKASDYFKVYNDQIIEIGLTANRGDAASHLGVARDLRAMTGVEVTMPLANVKIPDSGANHIQVTIEDREGCIRYSGLSVSQVQVKESPAWLKNRLKAIGLNPINNIVDVTNYVLHALGQPLHAFDADKINGSAIIVKKAVKDSKFHTLDKVERMMNGEECMICDADKPLALAGVFGGMESGINAATTNIFIESATFNPASVRKTAKAHSLSTDASFRFERGTDPEMTIPALLYAAHLIKEIAGGHISSTIVDAYPVKILPAQINFSIDRFTRLIGQEIPLDEIKSILSRLEIKIKNEKEGKLELEVPAYRVDVKREADIAEEILRIYGLNRIDIPSQVRSAIVFSEDEKKYTLRNRIADVLSANGFCEMINNSLTSASYYTEEELKNSVTILNPLSNELGIMRMNMVYNGLEVIRYNINRKATDLRLYEYGFTYAFNNARHVENEHLALFITGNRTAESWVGKALPADYFSVKATIELVMQRAGIPDFTLSPGTSTHILQQATTMRSGELNLVEFGLVPHSMCAAFDISQDVYFADFNMASMITAGSQRHFRLSPISPFPSVRRDLALELDRKVTFDEIKQIAAKTGKKLITSMNVFDVYEGEKISAGKKSYAISFILQNEEKTLTDTEIEGVMNKLITSFEKELGARVRM